MSAPIADDAWSTRIKSKYFAKWPLFGTSRAQEQARLKKFQRPPWHEPAPDHSSRAARKAITNNSGEIRWTVADMASSSITATVEVLTVAIFIAELKSRARYTQAHVHAPYDSHENRRWCWIGSAAGGQTGLSRNLRLGRCRWCCAQLQRPLAAQ